MKSIGEMNREELLALDPDDVKGLITSPDVIHMARTLGAFWSYDYKAANEGRVGLHAELKSKNHSDGFFISRLLLEPPNIRTIIARQMVARIEQVGIPADVAFVAGVPDSATLLGEEVAKILSLPVAEMEKDKKDGKIRLLTPIQAFKRIILIEDVCTKGTGFIEAVNAILDVCPDTRFLRFNPVILNRGRQKEIIAHDILFRILPIAEYDIQDWQPGPTTCRLCGMGSVSIRPKAEPQNWEKLVSSQKE